MRCQSENLGKLSLLHQLGCAGKHDALFSFGADLSASCGLQTSPRHGSSDAVIEPPQST